MYVVCGRHGCHHLSRLDLEKVARRFGRSQRSLHADLVRLPWRCVEYSSRHVMFPIATGRYYQMGMDPDEPLQDEIIGRILTAIDTIERIRFNPTIGCSQ